MDKIIKTALISVFSKENLENIVLALNKLNVNIISTGGTRDFIEKLGIKVIPVEEITGYPSILGGRVKSLHPKIFGGILSRASETSDQKEIQEYDIQAIDLVIVDLYPFADTLANTDNSDEVIEKIDIGGISLIRAAAKNFQDVLIIPSRQFYPDLLSLLSTNICATSIETRKQFAGLAFQISSDYDELIHKWLSGSLPVKLRYGENPHQNGYFEGKLSEIFNQLHGKEISYNNLLDIDSALALINDFSEPSIAIIKHNNACGLASDDNLSIAWHKALAGDPVSAFGGVIVCNREIDYITASEINHLFFEIILAPSFTEDAMNFLKQKKNRIILKFNNLRFNSLQKRSILNGSLIQERDLKTEDQSDLKVVTNHLPDKEEIDDLLFANKIVKHSKSNAIVLAKAKQLLASGIGETSRIDALKHAIEKAKNFGFSLQNAVLASDAFFPFSDTVELAHSEGIRCIIQPGGSVRDQESIDFCNDHSMVMVFTGFRHFRH
jgi:phosphoribosylaminoimidazolecarboxamide formyltransferase/IMP cyclohydrolase